MSLTKFADRLSSLGCTTNVNGDAIDIDIDGHSISVSFNTEWLSAISGFYRARQYQFDESRRVVSGNRFVEFQVTKLDPGFSYKPFHRFTDSKENEVVLSSASKEYLLSYFESDLYENSFSKGDGGIK